MSIEGMWCFISGEVGAPVMESGGVVILDTQRIYGGDSAMAYLGRYDLDGGTIRGEVVSWGYNPAMMNEADVFGQRTDDARRTTEFVATLNGEGFLVGSLKRNGVEVPLVLQKLSELP